MKPECKITQGFGQNATDTYIKGGLKGHCGCDSDCGYGSPIHSYWDTEKVYKVLTVQNPANDGSGFTGVFTIVEQGGEVFEFLYGHCNPSVTVGQILTKGTVLGTQANNGEVYANGQRITLDMQKAGDHRGTHRHDQKRVLRKDTNILPNTRYITAQDGSFYFDGSYYAIPLYSNGFNGCVNWVEEAPTPFQVMMNAVKAYQISKGIMDFANETNPKKIKIGPKTLAAIEKDQK